MDAVLSLGKVEVGSFNTISLPVWCFLVLALLRLLWLLASLWYAFWRGAFLFILSKSIWFGSLSRDLLSFWFRAENLRCSSSLGSFVILRSLRFLYTEIWRFSVFISLSWIMMVVDLLSNWLLSLLKWSLMLIFTSFFCSFDFLNSHVR